MLAVAKESLALRNTLPAQALGRHPLEQVIDLQRWKAGVLGNPPGKDRKECAGDELNREFDGHVMSDPLFDKFGPHGAPDPLAQFVVHGVAAARKQRVMERPERARVLERSGFKITDSGAVGTRKLNYVRATVVRS
ncbi:hypothetical protein P9272_08495 [Mesorhizobium sp. WSM4976]|uniref:hypothetical protein n=1 Tax=Mesorhizobium sp. WSM4976 TaxID=3038549 RepID=UPI002417946B|nr:hypothetical protein [Mesorhizobium sp. WSM4976]MDG4893610.1 hypothetical protein [Mesorhizobium sp. WSM4976]